jgi:hypothetical protein
VLYEHPKYHDNFKCGEIEAISFDDEGYPRKFYCIAHKVNFWCCGWEVGSHDGTPSKTYLSQVRSQARKKKSLPE